ncbi:MULTISPECIES: CDP-glycerol glycerophosphotransferase family protein [unclassified Sphingobium]|uniref:CDP-glycerol glycerophosphotransferase family protein n=1 Tax=unclassified Sphingobium TaxID=2611147 RepID=UPI00191866A1|nr:MULTISPECIES: CDP-glycerol glycerophosphotransferase family protein [unclassified Sphingobium]CAD7341485.1 UDP-N-acetylglucosamine--peptide N-acetylglucosaminyltransferase GtfA subunit [Sphingobium sp. S6]CAD7341730.1 UDP-N-acetylglucosamine--peptide N-acetylglucosaminyltransferase GtfA subunit [Sphingobium sp. S8]
MKYAAFSSVRAFRKVAAPKADRRMANIRNTLHQSGLFNAEFYQEKYHGQLPEGMNPLDHYILEGAAKRFAPSPWFDTAFYLTKNPDVARAGLNPLLHFAQHGWQELRSPSPKSYDFVWHWVMENKDTSYLQNPMQRHCAQYRSAGEDVLVRAQAPLTAEEVPLFAEACRSVLTRHKLHESALCIIGEYAVQNSLWSSAEDAYHALILQRPDVLNYRLALANAVERQGRTWQVADILRDAAKQAPDNADLPFRLGDALERMGRHAEAASAFAEALAIKDGSADWHYRHGYALERAGEQGQAKAAYDAAQKRDKKLNSAKFGVGVFHQARGLYKDAADAYAATAAENPINPELWFKLGFAYDRCYEWAKAQHAYSVAISQQFDRPYWHYRLGFVLERQEKWQESAGAYRTGADMDTEHRAYWYYRCGYVFEKASAYIEACSAYLLTSKPLWEAYKASGPAFYAQWLPQARADAASANADVLRIVEGLAGAVGQYAAGVSREGKVPAIHRRASHAHAQAKLLEMQGQLEPAVQTYRLALDLSPDHRPAWHRDLGGLLARLGRYNEACEAFRNSRILKRAYGVDITKYEASKGAKARIEYCEYLETLPIRRNTILYDSWLGGAIGCNPYAIFRYVIDRPEFSGWTHIWAINDPLGIPEEYAGRDNVIFIPRDCDSYRRYLATAEYLINNVTFPYWFIRREEQKYLNTWHGTPLKALGRDVKREFMTHGNVTRNFVHATHLLNPNRHTSDVMMRRYDVDGIYAGKVAETGYPRIDQVANPDENRRRQLLKELGLRADKPVVLYAPTWRGVQGKPQTDTDRVIADVSAMVSEDYQLVFRGHHLMESAISGLDIPVAVARQRIDSCDLLSIADVLVTDYSSILFDFLPTGRPIVYYAYDLEEYGAGQGFYFDIADLPGTLCKIMEEVREAVRQGLGQSVKDDPSYQQALTQFCPFEDGNSTKRAVEFFFSCSDKYVVDCYNDSRKSIVMYNGMFPINGVTSSYLSLLRSLEGENIQITTLFDPAKIRIDSVRIKNFRSMPDSVKCVAQLGAMVLNPEETDIVARLSAQRIPASEEMWAIYLRAYGREYRRVFGDAKHDTFVNFEGYNSMVAHIAAAAPAHVRKIMYLHNDMIGERDVRLPHLERIFRLYNHYDSLVSVSRSICEVNSDKLRGELDIDHSKFVFCENTIDAGSIVTMSELPIDDELKPWFGGRTTFLCLARMSPEKGQAKLVRAFAKVREQRPDAKLVILGDGPLRQELALLVEKLGISDSVKLAGARINPFPALKASDCLVLSSDHEGQGLVLIEALVLGKPIIATDIVTSRDVLGDEYGELVENSEDGLRRGMLAFLEKGVRPYSFSASEYQARAVTSFRNVVLSEKEDGPGHSMARIDTSRRREASTH